MMERLAGNGVRTIIIESPDRFARDLSVQLAGHDFLKKQGVTLIPATAPDHFVEDTPTAVLVRQVLGAIAQFEKASLVAKLKAARDRKIAAGIKCGGRKSFAERDPDGWPKPSGYTVASTNRCVKSPVNSPAAVTWTGTAGRIPRNRSRTWWLADDGCGA
jgi:hypothetical protein